MGTAKKIEKNTAVHKQCINMKSKKLEHLKTSAGENHVKKYRKKTGIAVSKK
jgi:hypothetical protein